MTARHPGTGVEPLVHEMRMTDAEVEARKRYLGFDAGDERRLRLLGELVGDRSGAIVEAFYRHVLAFDETRAFFATPEEVERIKGAQRRYFERLTEGSYDRAYAEERLRVGAVHERVGLEVKYYLGMYGVYLREVSDLLAAAFPHDAEQALTVQLSLLKLFLLDTGLALDMYVFRRERELQAAIRELETFNYSISHDLRAPLRAIIGFSEALMEDSGDSLDEPGRGYLRFIAQGGRRMSELIESLLQLSRLSQAEMLVQPVCLTDLAAAVVRALPAASRPGVELRIEPGIWATADPRLVSVLLESLLDNAVKFTSRHPTAAIQLGVSWSDGQPAAYVRDDGAGFDMANGDRLFGAFQRLHAESDFEGIGIGLATAMRIVRRHGGRIWAEGALEKGATFSFTLPDLRKEP
jgi:signal transduction histidine kinase